MPRHIRTATAASPPWTPAGTAVVARDSAAAAAKVAAKRTTRRTAIAVGHGSATTPPVTDRLVGRSRSRAAVAPRSAATATTEKATSSTIARETTTAAARAGRAVPASGRVAVECAVFDGQATAVHDVDRAAGAQPPPAAVSAVSALDAKALHIDVPERQVAGARDRPEPGGNGGGPDREQAGGPRAGPFQRGAVP